MAGGTGSKSPSRKQRVKRAQPEQTQMAPEKLVQTTGWLLSSLSPQESIPSLLSLLFWHRNGPFCVFRCARSFYGDPNAEPSLQPSHARTETWVDDHRVADACRGHW